MLMVDIMLVRSGCFQQEAKPAPPSTKPALKCGFDELRWFYMEMNQKHVDLWSLWSTKKKNVASEVLIGKI